MGIQTTAPPPNEIALRLASRIFDQPIIQNQYRSAFIEAMLEPHLAQVGWRYTGDGWTGWDFENLEGRRLEVKQSAAHQTWSSQSPSRGSFDIAARAGYFDQGGSRWTALPGRCAELYVFGWNGKFGAETDHRNPAQWEFYVVPTTGLPAAQKTISLMKLASLASAVPLGQVGERTTALLRLTA